MGSHRVVAIILCSIILFTDFLVVLAYYAIRSSYHGCSCDEIILRINCSGTQMQSLPEGLPGGYYSLYFDDNNLTVLNEETFNLSSMTIIRELSIVASNVYFVEDNVLASLTSLLWLDMRHNFLRVVPYGIDRMTRLQMLDLRGNFISSIPLDTFSDHSRLTSLFLEDNLIDISLINRGAFSALVNLRKLGISSRMDDPYSHPYYNPSYGDEFGGSYDSAYEGGHPRCLNVSFWFDRPTKELSLVELKLTNNKIGCVSRGSFSDWFGNLQILNLGHNRIEGLPNRLFAPLISLEELYLEANELNDIPNDTFSTNAAMRVLSLTSNRLLNFSDALITPASGRLERLDVSKNSLTAWDGTSHGEYRRLRYLNLTSNSISSDKPITFTNIPRLRSLDMSSNRLGYFPNVTGLRHLKDLVLSFNRIKNLPEHSLRGCRRLTKLSVKHNLLRTLSESAVSAAKNLEVLDISRNPLDCDCNLRWLGADMNILPDVYYNMIFSTKCASPKFLRDLLIGTVLQEQMTDLTCSEYADPSSMLWLVSIWLSVLGLIVCFNVYQICPLSRRRFHAFCKKTRVSEFSSTFPSLLRRDNSSQRYKIMGEVVDVAEEQPERLSSPSSPESPIKSLPSSSSQWAKIPETQV